MLYFVNENSNDIRMQKSILFLNTFILSRIEAVHYSLVSGSINRPTCCPHQEGFVAPFVDLFYVRIFSAVDSPVANDISSQDPSVVNS